MFSIDLHLAMLENLACSNEPKSNAVWSLSSWQVHPRWKGQGGCSRQSAVWRRPHRWTRRRMTAQGAPQRLGRWMKSCSRNESPVVLDCMPMDPDPSLSRTGWWLSVHQPPHVKPNQAQASSIKGSTLTSQMKSSGNQQMVTGAGLRDLEAPSHELTQ